MALLTTFSLGLTLAGTGYRGRRVVASVARLAVSLPTFLKSGSFLLRLAVKKWVGSFFKVGSNLAVFDER